MNFLKKNSIFVFFPNFRLAEAKFNDLKHAFGGNFLFLLPFRINFVFTKQLQLEENYVLNGKLSTSKSLFRQNNSIFVRMHIVDYQFLKNEKLREEKKVRWL